MIGPELVHRAGALLLLVKLRGYNPFCIQNFELWKGDIRNGSTFFIEAPADFQERHSLGLTGLPLGFHNCWRLWRPVRKVGQKRIQ